MKFVSLSTLIFAQSVAASLFFHDSRSDQIKNHLSNAHYEILDSAGLVKDSIFESLDRKSIEHWLEAHGVFDAGEHYVEVARKNKNWLLEDIHDFAEAGNEHAAAFVAKGKEFYADQANHLDEAAIKARDALHGAAVNAKSAGSHAAESIKDYAESVKDSVAGHVHDAEAAVSGGFWHTWSDSKLKEFLDARGVKVPQHTKRDELQALVARTKHSLPMNHKGPSGNYWFDGWSVDELKKKLSTLGHNVDGSRKELTHRLYTAYTNGREAGKIQGDEAAESVHKHWGHWKDTTEKSLHSWSIEDLTEYVKDFGYNVAEHTKASAEHTKASLVEAARNSAYFFNHGELPPKTYKESLHRKLSYFSKSLKARLFSLIGAGTAHLEL